MKREMNPTLEMEASYPGEVPTSRETGEKASAEKVHVWRPRWPGKVDKHRCPKAEKDARRHGVSGGEDDRELGKDCLVRALLDTQPGGHEKAEGLKQGSDITGEGHMVLP